VETSVVLLGSLKILLRNFANVSLYVQTHVNWVITDLVWL
jgi:hypothetical protein